MKKERIQQLKKEKNAMILAHYYVDNDVQDVADYIGDSFYLSKIAKESNADWIIFAGVKFMGESAKLLNPSKRVFMPDNEADCPMAHMITALKIKEMKDKYEDLAVVCYINSTAKIKALADVCVTSANAVKIVKKLNNKNIFFIPDQNLGDYVKRQVPEKNVILNDGYCPHHHKISQTDITNALKLHPDALVAVHPECQRDVLDVADYVGSTSGIISFVENSNNKEFIIVTVDGVFYDIEKKCPGKVLYRAVSDQTCPDMKKVTLDKIIDVLENESHEVLLDDDTKEKALLPLDRMLDLARED